MRPNTLRARSSATGVTFHVRFLPRWFRREIESPHTAVGRRIGDVHKT
jgi:hypothetical protein